MKLTALAHELAVEYHEGQFRKKASPPLPYIVHPEAVASLLERFFIIEENKTRPVDNRTTLFNSDLQYAGYPVDVYICAAFMHDLLEDTKATESSLRLAYYEKVAAAKVTESTEQQIREVTNWNDAINAVVLLTKTGKNYVSYLKGIAHYPVARLVKLADLDDNMKDLENGSLREKYQLSRWFLLNSDYVVKLP